MRRRPHTPELRTDAPGTGTARSRLPALAAWAAVGVVMLLQVMAVHQQSLTMDEPYHLLAGHQALRFGRNTLNLEHPPFVKLVAALPSLLEDKPLAPPVPVQRALNVSSRAVFRHPELTQRLRLGSGYLLLAFFGLPFLVGAWLLGRETAGGRTGVVLALLLGLSLSVLPYLSIAQTDAALALGCVLGLAGALRWLARPGWPAALLTGGGLGLALAAKLSGVLLLPPVLLALAIPLWRQGKGRRSWAPAALVVLLAVGVPWSTYAVANRHYDPAQGRQTLRAYCRNQATLVVDNRMRSLEDSLLAVERLAPNLAQWLTGLAGIQVQNVIGIYPSYAFGRVTSEGRWWYFPVVLLLKTPVAILAASLLALVAWGRRRRDQPRCPSPMRERTLLLILAAALYLGAAMSSSYNLGVRHLLPLLPILYLPAAAWAARRPPAAVLLVGVLALEALLLAPLWMSATNTWWLGRANPFRFALAADNCEYKQNFVTLGDWAEAQGIDRLHVLFPLTGAAELRAYIPGAVRVDPEAPPEAGWYAVTVLVEQLVPAILRASPEELHGYEALRRLAERWEPAWRQVRQGEDQGYAAGTFHIYRLP